MFESFWDYVLFFYLMGAIKVFITVIMTSLHLYSKLLENMHTIRGKQAVIIHGSIATVTTTFIITIFWFMQMEGWYNLVLDITKTKEIADLIYKYNQENP